MVCYVLNVINEFTRVLMPVRVYDSKEKALAGAFEDFEELVSTNGWDGLTKETIEKCKRKLVDNLEDFDFAYIDEFDTVYRIEQCKIN